MQTFLPYADFAQSAAALDNTRLFNQANECKTILRTIRGEISGWRHHPAVKMWRGHVECLAAYGASICTELISRDRASPLYDYFVSYMGSGDHKCPRWLGNEAFHRAHQSNLIKKLPEHYGPLFLGVPNNLPYVWPTP